MTESRLSYCRAGFCTTICLAILVVITLAISFVPAFFLENSGYWNHTVRYRTKDDTLTIETNIECKRNFYELRTQTKDIYEGYMEEKALTQEKCDVINTELEWNEEKLVELYQYLLEGTDISMARFNSDEALFENVSEIYTIRVEKGLENVTAY